MTLAALLFVFCAQCALYVSVQSADYISKTYLFSDVKEHYQLSSFTNILSKYRYLDLVFIGDDHLSVTVQTFEPNNVTYSEPAGYQYSFQHNTNLTDYKIVGVMPADFNADKTTDLMVVFANSKGSAIDYLVALLWNHDGKFSYASYISTKFSGIPHLLDYNGDRFIDFVCAEESKRYFYLNNVDQPGTFTKQNLDDTEDENAPEVDVSETVYVYADLNGDCAADLFMITKLKNKTSIFEYYQATDKTLKKNFEMAIPSEAAADQYSAPLVTDLDGNGKLDIVIAGCSSIHSGVCQESKIFTFYNDACHTTSADKCKKETKACKTYDFSATTMALDLIVFEKFEHNKDKYGFKPYDKTDIYSSKFFLRASDVDSDGHVDLVAILKYDESQEAVIFFNKASPLVPVGRTFQPQWRDDIILEDDLTSVYEPFAIAPVDVLGNGNVQFLLIGRNKNDKADFALSFLVRKDMLDALWLKVTILCEKCDSLSTTMVGANAFYSTTGYTGEPEVRYGAQNSQLTSFSLQPPYMLFGLGQQANYIESLTVAYRNTDKDRSVNKFTFDNLIPNAQVSLFISFAKLLSCVYISDANESISKF